MKTLEQFIEARCAAIKAEGNLPPTFDHFKAYMILTEALTGIAPPVGFSVENEYNRIWMTEYQDYLDSGVDEVSNESR